MSWLRGALILLALVLFGSACFVAMMTVWVGAGAGAFAEEWASRLEYSVDARKFAEVARPADLPSREVLRHSVDGFVSLNAARTGFFATAVMVVVGLALLVIGCLPLDILVRAVRK